MLHGCSTWTMRFQDCSSMRTTHHKLLLRFVGFRREDRTGYKPLSYGKALERTGSQRTQTIFRNVNMGGGSRRVMFGVGWWCKGPYDEFDR